MYYKQYILFKQVLLIIQYCYFPALYKNGYYNELIYCTLLFLLNYCCWAYF